MVSNTQKILNSIKKKEKKFNVAGNFVLPNLSGLGGNQDAKNYLTSNFSDIAHTHNTDNLTEGSTNIFHTASRVKAVDFGTQGSVLFLDSDGNITEDNSNFYFDNTNNRLGIGTNSPSHPLEITGDAKIDGDIILQDASVFDVKPISGDVSFTFESNDATTQGVQFSFFRTTDTSSHTRFLVFKGDGTGTSNTSFAGKGLNSYICQDNGSLGVGTVSPNKKFDVKGDISIEAGSGDYYSNDGSKGATGSFTDNDGNTVTVKNGIITSLT